MASIRELHRVAASHGYVKTDCFIRPLSSDDVNMMFCAHSSAYFTRSRCEQNQHVPMSAALDAPASWLVRRPGLLRCCSWAAWLAA